MFKRYICTIFLIFLILAVLAACGKKKTQTPSENEKVPTEEEIITYPPEDLDLDSIVTISSQGSGYDSVLRLKSTKEILFSPNLTEFAQLIAEGSPIEDYTMGLVFVLLDDEGNEYHAYPECRVPIQSSKGDWFDIFLMADGVDCGFCPTAGKRYTVEVSIYDKEQKKIMEGVWRSLWASEGYAESPYYNPTAIPDENEKASMTFSVQYLPIKGGILKGYANQTLKAGQGSKKVSAVADKGYVFVGWSDGYIYPVREGDTFIRSKVIYAKFEKVTLDGSVPNMYIQTETGAFITSKEEYMNATISIAGALQDEYNVTLATEIRGRGNSSFHGTSDINDYGSKNSYRLKLTEKANLLGVGDSANRDWVLNANKFDASGLRNYAVWNLARQMQTFPFVPGCTWVNLYVNGDYRGLYMLTDHVEVAEDRVEVDDSLEAPDKGFLLELDFRGDGESGAVEGLTYFYANGFGAEWVIKSKVYSTSETAYIRNYINACHSAIMSGNRATIDALVDIPSLMDMIIIEELSKDVDAGGTSLYMQKDKGGKLYFTAPWDFDFGFGTYGPATYVDGFVCEDGGHPWYAALLSQDWFLKELKARMAQVDEMLEQTKKGIMNINALLTPAADHQDERWNIYGNHYHGYVSGEVSADLDSNPAHGEFLCSWIEQRWAWMCAEIDSRVSRLG